MLKVQQKVIESSTDSTSTCTDPHATFPVLIAGLSLLALFYLEFRWFMTRVKCWWKRLCGKLAAGPLPCTGLGAHRDEYSGMPSGPPDPVRQRRLLTQKAWGPYNQGEWRHFPHIQHHHTGLITPTIVGGGNK